MLMQNSTRRAFLRSAAGFSVSATVLAADAQAQRARGTAFAGVRDIEESLRRIPIEQYPKPFTEDEYQNRLTRCREAMSARDIDLLFVTTPEGMCYLHGLESTWYRAHSSRQWPPLIGTAVHVDHDRCVHFSVGEVALLAETSVVKDKRFYPGGRGGVAGGAQFLVKELQSLGWLKGGTRVGLEYWSYIPNRAVSQMYEQTLAAAGARVSDGSDVMRTIRLVKSPAELEAMEHAGRIVDIGFKAIAEAFRPGMSHLEVYAAATHAMYVAGGEPSALQTAVWPGVPREGVRIGHLPPARRQISANEVFAVDLCGVYKRYHTNVTRTFLWGDPGPELLRMVEVSKGAFDVVTNMAKAGVRVATVTRALREYYNGQGWERVQALGYELGISFPPDWCGEFMYSAGDENASGQFQANAVTNYESVLQKTLSEKELLLVGNIDTIVYGAQRTRRLSAIPLDLIVLG
jgi:Xaa-Pro dipeptidase